MNPRPCLLSDCGRAGRRAAAMEMLYVYFCEFVASALSLAASVTSSSPTGCCPSRSLGRWTCVDQEGCVEERVGYMALFVAGVNVVVSAFSVEVGTVTYCKDTRHRHCACGRPAGRLEDAGRYGPEYILEDGAVGARDRIGERPCSSARARGSCGGRSTRTWRAAPSRKHWRLEAFSCWR